MVHSKVVDPTNINIVKNIINNKTNNIEQQLVVVGWFFKLTIIYSSPGKYINKL